MQGKDELLPDIYSDTKSSQAKLKSLYKYINEQFLNRFVCCKTIIESSKLTSYRLTIKINFLNIIENLQNYFLIRSSDKKKINLFR